MTERQRGIRSILAGARRAVERYIYFENRSTPNRPEKVEIQAPTAILAALKQNLNLSQAYGSASS